MTEEEAIGVLQEFIEYGEEIINDTEYEVDIIAELEEIQAIETVLNMLKEKDRELEEKDKTIDEMVEKIIDYKDYLEGLSDDCQLDCFLYHKVNDCNSFKDCKKCVKEYFEKKEG